MTSPHTVPIEVGAGPDTAPVAGVSVDSSTWLVALDVDGTIMPENGEIPADAIAEIRRLRAEGHQVMIATGRSVAFTLPILERIGLVSDYVVCANGAITLGRDDTSETGYRQVFVEEFDPGEVLNTISDRLVDASFAVEDRDGQMFYKGTFPEVALTSDSHAVSFDDLCSRAATRVVVLSPSHSLEEFLEIVESMGLHKVSYNVGWTAWLDIAPFGVTKATALERVRSWLGLPASRTMAVGDGRNDIDMLQWASRGGRGVAMGQAPADVIEAASEVTGADVDHGLAAVLATL